MKRAAPLSTGSAILCAPVLTRDGMLFFAHLLKDVCMGLFLEIVVNDHGWFLLYWKIGALTFY